MYVAAERRRSLSCHPEPALSFHSGRELPSRAGHGSWPSTGDPGIAAVGGIGPGDGDLLVEGGVLEEYAHVPGAVEHLGHVRVLSSCGAVTRKR